MKKLILLSVFTICSYIFADSLNMDKVSNKPPKVNHLTELGVNPVTLINYVSGVYQWEDITNYKNSYEFKRWLINAPRNLFLSHLGALQWTAPKSMEGKTFNFKIGVRNKKKSGELDVTLKVTKTMPIKRTIKGDTIIVDDPDCKSTLGKQYKFNLQFPSSLHFYNEYFPSQKHFDIKRINIKRIVENGDNEFQIDIPNNIERLSCFFKIGEEWGVVRNGIYQVKSKNKFTVGLPGSIDSNTKTFLFRYTNRLGQSLHRQRPKKSEWTYARGYANGLYFIGALKTKE